MLVLTSKLARMIHDEHYTDKDEFLLSGNSMIRLHDFGEDEVISTPEPEFMERYNALVQERNHWEQAQANYEVTLQQVRRMNQEAVETRKSTLAYKLLSVLGLGDWYLERIPKPQDFEILAPEDIDIRHVNELKWMEETKDSRGYTRKYIHHERWTAVDCWNILTRNRDRDVQVPDNVRWDQMTPSQIATLVNMLNPNFPEERINKTVQHNSKLRVDPKFHRTSYGFTIDGVTVEQILDSVRGE